MAPNRQENRCKILERNGKRIYPKKAEDSIYTCRLAENSMAWAYFRIGTPDTSFIYSARVPSLYITAPNLMKNSASWVTYYFIYSAPNFMNGGTFAKKQSPWPPLRMAVRVYLCNKSKT
jgi:hypothetical protein